MQSIRFPFVNAPTGITDMDEITGASLARRRTTLLVAANLREAADIWPKLEGDDQPWA
jgi:hypothetical protein